MNKSVWFFDHLDVFEILCPHKFNEFKENHVFSHYKKGDYIYFEDDSATKVYLISSGKVKIGIIQENGDELISSILTKGQIFGEKAILGIEKQNEFAQALEDQTVVCVIGIETMYEMLKKNNDFSISIYKFIGNRYSKLERRLQLLLFKDVKTRLLEFIKELEEEYGYRNAITGDLIIRHPFTQKEIATLIGVSRPTFNTVLNQLKNENKLSFDRKQIVLFNR